MALTAALQALQGTLENVNPHVVGRQGLEASVGILTAEAGPGGRQGPGEGPKRNDRPALPRSWGLASFLEEAEGSAYPGLSRAGRSAAPVGGSWFSRTEFRIPRWKNCRGWGWWWWCCLLSSFCAWLGQLFKVCISALLEGPGRFAHLAAFQNAWHRSTLHKSSSDR